MHFVLVLVAPSEDYQPLCDRWTNMQLIHLVTMHKQFADTVVANAELYRDVCGGIVVANRTVRSLAETITYSAFNYRGLPIITNNQAGCILVDAETTPMKVYVTNEAYAKKINANAYGLSTYPGYYYWGLIDRN
jgi:hypothetical protein